MNFTDKKILIPVGVFVTLAVLYFIFKDDVDAKIIDFATGGETPDDDDLDENKVLKKGSRGGEVMRLQELLNDDMSAPLVRLKVDGIFGTKTETGLKDVKSQPSISLKQYAGTKNIDLSNIQTLAAVKSPKDA